MLRILVLTMLCLGTVAHAQETSAKKSTGPKLCVALQNQYAPKFINEKASPREFFTFPFDLVAQDASAADVDYSPDNKYLTFCMGWFNAGGWLVVWDLEKDKERFSVWLGLGARSVQYSPDGKQIAVACFDQSAKVFDAGNGELLGVLPIKNTNGTNSVSYSPDGKTIATGGLHSQVILWDATTFQEKNRFSGHKVRIYSAAYSPDGTMIASVDRSGKGIVWDVESGKAISNLVGHDQGIEMVDFTRDNLWVVTAGWDGSVRFWDPRSGKEETPLRRNTHPSAMCVAASVDGKYMASSGAGQVIEWFDPATEEAIVVPHNLRQRIYGMCFSPDGKEFAAASFDGQVKRWKVENQEEIGTITMQHHFSEPVSPAMCADWSPDGKYIVSGHANGEVQVLDPTNYDVIDSFQSHAKEVAALAVSADSRWLATCGCDNEIRLYDFSKIGELDSKLASTLSGHEDWVVSCAFSADSKWLATGSLDKTVRIWDLETKAEVNVLESHKEILRTVAFSPGSKSLVTGDDSGQVMRWETEHWKRTASFKRNKVRSANYSPSGDRLAIGCESGGIFILDSESLMVQSKIEKTFGLTSMAWSPNGDLIVFGNLKGKIQLRDAKTGETLKTFGQHQRPVTSVDFAPSGNAFVSSSVDKRLLRWNALLPLPQKE